MDIIIKHRKVDGGHFFTSLSICGVCSMSKDWVTAYNRALKQVNELLEKRGLGETIGNIRLVEEGLSDRDNKD